MKKTVLIWTLLLLACIPGFSQQLSFYRESLNFELDSSRFYVSGMYFIRNNADKAISTHLFYPYIYDTSVIDSISVYNCNTMQSLDVLEGKKGHRFNLAIPANDSAVLNIRYNHLHNHHSVTYILTSTRFWGRAFNEADYTLRVQKGIKPTQLFMSPDTLWSDNEYLYYYWKRFQFMPDKDFIVEF